MRQRPGPATCMGMSVLVHGVLIGGLLLAAEYGQRSAPARPVSVDVEIIPSVLIDKGNTDSAFSPADERPAPRRKAQKVKVKATAPAPATPPAPAAAPPDPLPAVQPGEGAVTVPAPPAAQPGGREQASPGAAVKAVESDTGKRNDTAAEEGGSYAPPGYRSGDRPAYPAEARRAGWRGTVTLRILVDTSGLPATVTVRVGSGYATLDDAAVQAVKKWRFSPAKKGGQAIASYHDVRVRFRLEDAR